MTHDNIDRRRLRDLAKDVMVEYEGDAAYALTDGRRWSKGTINVLLSARALSDEGLFADIMLSLGMTEQLEVFTAAQRVTEGVRVGDICPWLPGDRP